MCSRQNTGSSNTPPSGTTRTLCVCMDRDCFWGPMVVGGPGGGGGGGLEAWPPQISLLFCTTRSDHFLISLNKLKSRSVMWSVSLKRVSAELWDCARYCTQLDDIWVGGAAWASGSNFRVRISWSVQPQEATLIQHLFGGPGPMGVISNILTCKKEIQPNLSYTCTGRYFRVAACSTWRRWVHLHNPPRPGRPPGPRVSREQQGI